MKRLICLMTALLALFLLVAPAAGASKIQETSYFKCVLPGDRYQSFVKFQGYRVSSKTFFATKMTYLIKGGGRIGDKNNIEVGSKSNSSLYFQSRDNLQADRRRPTSVTINASLPRGKTLFLTTVFDFYFSRDSRCVTSFRL